MRVGVSLLASFMCLSGCSSPQQKAGLALERARGWAATAEAVTSDRVAGALPAQFVARTLDAGAQSVETHAQTIERIHELPEPERQAAADVVRQLARSLRDAASSAQAGKVDAPHKALLLDSYAAVMAHARTYPR